MTEEIRIHHPTEAIKNFKGHKADCHYCEGGIVKMSRNVITMLLQPDKVSCLQCGQRYIYEMENYSKQALMDLDLKFWREKADEN